MKPEVLSKHCAAPSTEKHSDEVHMQVEQRKELEKFKILNKKGALMITRPQSGSKGQKILLLANYFKVSAPNKVPHFYHYDISVLYDNGQPVGSVEVRRKVIAKLHETYKSQLAGRPFAYDGYKSFFTAGPLPSNKLDFVVVLTNISLKRIVAGGDLSGCGSPCEGDQKRHRLQSSAKTFKIQISFVSTISTQGITDAITERGPAKSEWLTVLDAILRHHAAKKDCLLLRQSYFANKPKAFMDLGGGILGCRGFSSRFQAIQSGLFLNFDVCTTTIIKPGPVIDFLISHQNVSDPFKIDWLKAKRILKNLRIIVAHRNHEYRVTGLSEKPCKHQKFCCTRRGASNQDGVVQTFEITVYDYFVKVLSIPLTYSADFPCIDVGKPSRPTFFPIELCSLVSLQRYKKALSMHQRMLMTSKSSLKPEDFSPVLKNELKSNDYNDDSFLRSCGLSIGSSLTQLEGRVLSAPRLKVGNREEIIPRNGSWSFRYKTFVDPKRVERWAVVNFGSQQDMQSLCKELAKVGAMHGLIFNTPMFVFEENPKYKKKPPNVRVEKMCEQIISKVPKDPLHFILCMIEKSYSPLYGAWKWKSLIELGVPNQCLARTRVDDSYLGNVILKINAKLGGLNSTLMPEVTRSIPWVSKVPTMILGMDYMTCVYGHTDLPSIAAVVGSRQWPSISCYRASACTQPWKDHIIHSLFRQVSEQEDKGIIRELLVDFYASSGQKKPEQIIIFRNGLSTSQFNQLLSIEMDQIFKACKLLDETWCPKFTLIVSQRSHHTKFIKACSYENVPPGTVIDKKICHLQCNNFFLCPHTSFKGTARPTHYHVLMDEIGFSSDEIQELVHSLSYVYQKSTTAISEVAPVRYARLAAAQMLELIKFDTTRKMYVQNGDANISGNAFESQLPKLHKNVCSSMFFC